MRRTLNWLLTVVVLLGTVTVSGTSAGAATAAEGDIKERILAVPGMSLIKEEPVDGYRFFILNYRQPADHRKPREDTFNQRLSILHKETDRPTVFFTSGYGLRTTPSRSEPTRLVDGNQVSMEYRYFTPSRPQPADWSQLDIWQAAMDQHRIYQALRGIYDRDWVSTGGSKGGMTATYYRRFFPSDMSGTVAYVAPNNVRDEEDEAYDRFFEEVSTKECRDRLNAVQREVFVRREEMVKRYASWAKRENATFEVLGDVDRAFEGTALYLVWAFWQYHTEAECEQVPKPTASTEELYDYVDEIASFESSTDQGLEYYTPYYYQASTQLGSPHFRTPHLADLLRYPDLQDTQSYVPGDIPMPRFDQRAMPDIDRWVRHHAERMLFVYGENDPWGAEPFQPGSLGEDSFSFTGPGANHGANIAALVERDRVTATRALFDWAGVDAPAATERPKPLAAFDARLDTAEEPHLLHRLP